MGILISKHETDEIKERLKDIDNIFNNFSKDQESIQKILESQNHAIESLRREKDDLMKLLDNSPRYHGSGTYDDTVRKLNEENSALKRKLREKEGEVANLQNTLDKLTREPVRVYMFASSMNERISNAVRSELQLILSQHIEATRDKKLEIVPLDDPKSIPANKPLIVLCINASRLGTDVEQALQQVTCSRSVTVAVIHHKEYHALPPQASEKLLHSEKIRELYAVVDIAFLTNKGMYTCDMNNKSLEKLTNFICEFSNNMPMHF
ncbi:uncharacterized protein LOC128177068 [Crassostrea angulata]|uniref:uncharacterized protein LOC128177068 n=1 Tax=Magallana angulata TaxID=2784310 RepID=UPI0022B0C8CC|nr:uncharacterized protein LOC128177068 [Crassostrea angulata]